MSTNFNQEEKQNIHKKISYIKSVARLLGYALLIPNITLAVIILFGSELLGIAEEIFGA